MTPVIAVREESEAAVRLTAHAALLGEAERFGLPLPAREDVFVTDPDPVAEVIIRAHIARLKAAGRIVTVIDDERRIGFRMDLGGVIYSVMHHRDRHTGSAAYTSADVARSAA